MYGMYLFVVRMYFVYFSIFATNSQRNTIQTAPKRVYWFRRPFMHNEGAPGSQNFSAILSMGGKGSENHTLNMPILKTPKGAAAAGGLSFSCLFHWHMFSPDFPEALAPTINMTPVRVNPSCVPPYDYNPLHYGSDWRKTLSALFM